MAKVEVTMPKMGESITEGTVIEWLKQPGDTIEMDEPLLEIGTDKVDTEVPSPSAGVLSEILVQEGDTVDVGTVIAILDTDADATAGGGGSQSEPASEPEPEPEPEPQAEPQPEPASNAGSRDESASSGGSGGGSRVEVLMPKMGESIMEGTVIAWAKKVGDSIDLDETLLEIATDKVDTEVPSPAAGTVQEILVEEGETVDVGTLIAVIGSGASAKAEPPKEPAGSSESASSQKATSQESSAPREDVGPIPRTGPDGEFFSPLVRSIAEAEKVSVQELRSISGSGRDGRVTKDDVLTFVEKRGSAPAAAPAQAVSAPPRPAMQTVGTSEDGRVEVVKMDRMRQIIAEHMVRSKSTSAHVTSFAEIDVTNLVRLRERTKEGFQKREGIKLTYTPFFVYAAVEALRDHPMLNCSVEGDTVLLRKDFHIGIAVAIGKTGLVAPVIRDAGQRNIVGLAQATADLASRARNKQLMPDQLSGGTFTVTNVGSLGSIMGTPIINQPQVGILATGAIKKRPVVIEDPVMGDVIAVRHMMFISLSYDHRIVDGAMASSFLRRYTDVLEGLDPNADV